MKFDERNPFFFKSPPFLFSWQLRQSFSTDSIFLAYLVPLDVDVTGYITGNICEAWSELKKNCTLVTMVTAAILNFFQPQKGATNYGG